MILRFFQGIGYFALLGLLLLVVAASLGSEYEGRVLPVTSYATVEWERPAPATDRDQGIAAVDFALRFDKLRACRFLGIVWHVNGLRLRLDRAAYGESRRITSRPLGPQRTHRWRLWGVTTLQGTSATVYHRCHPLWVTQTPFFPAEAG